jgi:hypothetical protein
MLTIVHQLVTTQAIPSLDETGLSQLLHYLFAEAEGSSLRVQVAEVAYRNHEHPTALDLFLASTMPLAQKMAERKAERLFVYPSDWQIECLYNGAVSALLGMFQHWVVLHPIADSFRRYLYRSMLKGAYRECFRREENCGLRTVENIDRLTGPKGTTRTAEEELITHDLLEQITQYPLLRRGLAKTLECIVALGPDLALRDNKTPDRWRNMQRYKRRLNVHEIAKARGIKPSVVLKELSLARAVIRKAFNPDGKLFQTR